MKDTDVEYQTKQQIQNFCILRSREVACNDDYNRHDDKTMVKFQLYIKKTRFFATK